MKRSLIIPVFLLSGLCLAAGCRSKNNVDLSSAHTTGAETMAPETEAETEAETAEEETSQAEGSSRPDSSRGLSTSMETYTSGNISIQYPSVSGLSSSETEDAVNELLKTNALSIVTAQNLNEETDSLTIRCQIISADRQRLTAVYTGELSASGAAYSTAVFYTNTVDMSQAEDVGFTTYAEPSTMAGYLMSNGCQFDGLDEETAAAVKEYVTSQSMDYYTQLFRQADFPLKGETFPESFSYEEEGAIYFSIPVPHALGDYAIAVFTPETK